MNSPAIKDTYLIEMVINGDNHAFNQLMTPYYQKIQLLICCHVHDQAISNDLTQDVLIKVFHYLDRFKQDCQFSTWIYRITLNTIKNYFRSLAQRAECELDEINQVEVNTTDPESLTLGIELGQKLALAYADLPIELKDCYGLYQFDGLSYQDISWKLKCPIGTVRSRIFRARQRLKAAI